jgi:hypothetical protein
MEFARDDLALALPLTLKAGITGIDGFRIAAPPQLFQNYEALGGRAVKHDVDFSAAIRDWGISSDEILRPLFEKVWDAFGLVRSNFASWLQPPG